MEVRRVFRGLPKRRRVGVLVYPLHPKSVLTDIRCSLLKYRRLPLYKGQNTIKGYFNLPRLQELDIYCSELKNSERFGHGSLSAPDTTHRPVRSCQTANGISFERRIIQANDIKNLSYTDSRYMKNPRLCGLISGKKKCSRPLLPDRHPTVATY